MSYVLRYAGLLDEARKECQAVFAEDPVHGFRSCAIPFTLVGDYANAEKFINLTHALDLRRSCAWTLHFAEEPGTSFWQRRITPCSSATTMLPPNSFGPA